MPTIKLQGQLEKQKGIHYEVDPTEPPIGIGGMGRVYKGVCVNEHTHEVKPVAIKFMFEDLPVHAIDRARREASIQLRNDNLVEMFGFIETLDDMGGGHRAKHYHVVSELLHGVPLSEMLEGNVTDFEGNEVPFAVEMLQMYKEHPEQFAIRIVKSVLAGIMALHDNGYIHRDIDPSNIMLTSDNHIKLIDFGIAMKLNTLSVADDVSLDGNRKERLVGKPKYAAPELVRADVNSQNQTTDIYSIGILLFQLTCGCLPFEGSMEEVMQMQLTKDMPLSNISNPALRDIIKRATEKKQEKRYQSASEFRVALDTMSTPPNPLPVKTIIFVTVGAILGLIVGACLALL
jgi:serine/threonine-protein kinase